MNAEKEEFFHIAPDNDGMAGPFDTIELAQADAMQYLGDCKWQVPEIRIVKTVAISETKVSYDTKWKYKWQV